VSANRRAPRGRLVNTTTDSVKFQTDRAVTRESARVLRIEPSSGWTRLKLTEMWEFGMWLSALNVQFRDLRYVVPFITQFWMLATPIAYPSSLLRDPGGLFTG